MFDRHIHRAHVISVEEAAAQYEEHHRQRATVEARIDEEHKKLEAWLNKEENKITSYYSLVLEIKNSFPSAEEHHFHELDFYYGREADLFAVNQALEGKGMDGLTARVEASMESKSKVLQASGVLMACLAVALLVSAICILNLVMGFIGGVIALASFLTYDAGATKVHTDKSRLFAQLSDAVTLASTPQMACNL